MNQYEVMYVIDTNIDETTRTNLINRMAERVAQNGGKVDRVDEWGTRRLAYPMNILNKETSIIFASTMNQMVYLTRIIWGSL